MEENSHILGHEKIEAFLARTLTSGKVFPVWIFDGIYGIGKGTMARKFAKCLLAGVTPSTASLDLPPENPVHRLVHLRIHPDFFVLEQKDETVLLEEVRDLMAKIWKTPALSHRKVLILENASTWSKNIYNALLKVLEEPPEDTVIILICNGTGTLPKTLLSRTAKLSFGPLAIDRVQELLDSNQQERSRELAELSGGSVGMALYLYHHHGLEIYDHLVASFDHDQAVRQKQLGYLLDNKLCDNFFVVKNIFAKVLKDYWDVLAGIACKKNSALEKFAAGWPIPPNPDRETAKILEIIHMLYLGHRLMLDKNALLVYAFAKMFARSYH
ncbi:MAG: hypothetical protein LBJ16_02385 [Holosporaceae bacterium]|jgi:DNA polymerase-3 subunit delta'|nr:hypothetical protein [Holosporaceae bacterium]